MTLKILLRSKKLNSSTSALKTFLSKLATKAIRTSKRISTENESVRTRKNERWVERSQLYIRFPNYRGGGERRAKFPTNSETERDSATVKRPKEPQKTSKTNETEMKLIG